MSPATRSVGVFVVDDNVAFTERVAQLVAGLPGMKFCGAAHTREAAKAHILNADIGVFLIDLGLPDGDGVSLIHCIHEQREDAAVIVVSVFADDEHVMQSIRAGASGYLLKDSSAEDLINGIQMTQAGGSPISPTIARRVLLLWQQAVPVAESPLKPLSSRELEVLQLIAKGSSLDEVARAMEVSRATVATHVRGIYGKLEVSSRGGAIVRAMKCGLLSQ